MTGGMGEEGQADPIEQAWEKLLGAWSDQEAHRKFIALCSSLGRLKEAGMRYREVREGSDPERRAQAERQIDRLLGVAMQSLESIRTPPPARTRRVLVFVALLVASLLVGGALWAALHRG